MMSITKFKSEYHSDLSDCDSDVNSSVNSSTNASDGSVNNGKRKRRTVKVWHKTQEFQSPKEAEDYVKSQKLWKKCTAYKGLEGAKVVYRCSAGVYRRQECSAGLYLLYHSDSSKVSLFETSAHSNHTYDRKRGLKTCTREIVRQLYNDGIRKPNAIIAAFRDQNLEEPSKTQLKNFLTALRSEKFDHPTISVAELLEWCKNNSTLPQGNNEPFVLSYKIESERNQDLGIVLSTKHLLQLACKSIVVQADATCKLVWQGYPVFVVGTSDFNRVFHPFAIAVCHGDKDTDFAFVFNSIKNSCLHLLQTTWAPIILLADASDAITNGFILAFGTPYRRLQCYLNMLKDVDSKLRTMDAFKEMIRKDIEALHLCTDDDSFNIACYLFLNKWQAQESSAINDFLLYFKTVWLGAHRYWYEGAYMNYSSTNDGLHSVVNKIKRENIFREQLPLGQFLDVIQNMILKKWSMDQDPQNPTNKPFALKPELSTKLWTETYQWLNTKPKIFEEKNSTEQIFYVLSSSVAEQELDEEYVKTYKSMHLQWRTFDEYLSYSTSLWKVHCEKTNESFQTFCSCPVYAKKYACKHSLGLLVLLGKEKVPLEAKIEQLGQKRKRGRPPKANKGPMMQ